MSIYEAMTEEEKKEHENKNKEDRQPRLVMNKYPGKYIFNWILGNNEFVIIQFERIKQHKDGRINARVSVMATLQKGDVNLHQGQLNLVAPRSRKEIANTLKERLNRKGLSWDYLIEETCRKVIDAEEDTTEAERLTEVIAQDPSFLVYPCIMDRLPVLWYGPGAAGKTMLAMFFSLLVQNGLSFLGRQVEQKNVLYLDWEVDKSEASRRMSYFSRHFQDKTGKEIIMPYYRQCLLPLFDEASSIAEDVAKHNIGLVFIDSAGPACGGDIMSAELAIQYFNALRKICAAGSAASVTLTHVTKNERRDKDQGRMPIGSIYFENYPRATWEMRPQDIADGEDKIAVGFFCRKINFKRPDKFGIEISFNGTKACPRMVQAEDVKSEDRILEEIILDELSTGPMTVNEIVEATGSTTSTVQKTLSLAKKKGKILRIKKGTYALTYRDST